MENGEKVIRDFSDITKILPDEKELEKMYNHLRELARGDGELKGDIRRDFLLIRGNRVYGKVLGVNPRFGARDVLGALILKGIAKLNDIVIEVCSDLSILKTEITVKGEEILKELELAKSGKVF